jgi:hypothetical protein
MQSAAVLSAFETALPDDERIVRKLMFGTPCAFVNRQMFFGTFEDTLVARIGPERVKALVDQPGAQVFCLSEGKVWDDYVQLDPSFDAQQLAALAAEALTWAAALPRKLKAPKALRRSRRRAKAKGPRD